MPKRKITESLWAEMWAAYTQWDPAGPGTIEDIVRPFNVSKQGFYAEMRRRGLSTKTEGGAGSVHQQTGERVVVALVRELVEDLGTAQLRVGVLERELAKHGIPLPAYLPEPWK